MRFLPVIPIAVFFTFGPALAARSAPPGAGARGIHRFALVVGANDGGPGRARLRFAGSDAQAFAKVMEGLGGVEPADCDILQEPRPAAFRAALGRIRDKLAAARKAGERAEVVVYYSGHSDEEGMLLGPERFAYADFRREVSALPADVRIAILDACASGAFTRMKGGRYRPPFLADATANMRGHAFLTSSAADEAAQESDRIGGSFFTHYLVTGLRGAADASRDGKVTLNEAYQFAYGETLARTEGTRGGPQHPGYDIDLSGSGDVVLTDLRRVSAGLVLAADLAGRVFVRAADGSLAAELAKPAGRPVELGLEPGTYAVTLEGEKGTFRSKVELAEGGRREVSLASLAPVPTELTAARGGPGGNASDTSPAPALVDIPVNAGLVPSAGLSVNGADAPRARNRLSLDLFYGEDAELQGFAFSPILERTRGPVAGGQFAGTITMAGPVTGAEVAGVANFADGAVRGVQLSQFFNRAAGGLRGLQMCAGVNLADSGADGAQVAGVANLARKPVRGAQVSVAANLAPSGAAGAQVAVGGNLADTMGGAQVAVGVNLAGRMDRAAALAVGANATRGGAGAQVAVGVNLADTLAGGQVAVGADLARAGRGLQMSAGLAGAGDWSGLQLANANAAGHVRGAQVGLLNLAWESDAAQVGVVNLAWKSRGAQAGLVNLAANYRPGLDLTADPTGMSSAAFTLTGPYSYGLFDYALGLRGDRPARGYGLGFGLKAPETMVGPTFLALELSSHQIYADRAGYVPYYYGTERGQQYYRARLLAGRELFGRFTPYAGLSYNTLLKHPGRGAFLDPIADLPASARGGWGRVWPGLSLGLRVEG